MLMTFFDPGMQSSLNGYRRFFFSVLKLVRIPIELFKTLYAICLDSSTVYSLIGHVSYRAFVEPSEMPVAAVSLYII
ncbi:hypothetical protein TNCT_500371 [Trichonephila clavata]|uniref:Uncharacterized protein n=1 Tax=Trichonephila clavata TaxID=2740835 RepID=A0A8X6FD52_TRICU|nr:hypothetical protein TNCT_500371 [Trichonephila clavata]